MAVEDLARILDRLKSESLDQLPIGQTADRVEMMAAEELAKIKKSEEAGKLASMVRNWRTACITSRVEDERQWYKNLDMYQGRQFTMWDRTMNRMVEPVAPDYEPRIAVNIIEPICRTEMAKTGSKHPDATVSPASNDQSDIMAALAGEAAWRWFYQSSRYQTLVFTPANFWRTTTGNGFIKSFRDDSMIDDAATEAAVRTWGQQVQQGTAQGLDPATAPPKPEPIRGKIRTHAISPFHLLVPDAAELDLQMQPYLIEQYTMPISKAKVVYKDFAPKDWNPTGVASTEVMNVAHIGIKAGASSQLDSVLILEAWVKPGITTLMPDGGLIIMAGDEIVAMSTAGIPYAHREFPYAHLTGIETGRFYRKSIIESITSLQNELNRTYAQLIKSKNLTVKPMFFFDEGSLDPTRIRSKAGTYIPIRLGMNRPTPVPIQDMPAYVLDLIERIKGHLDDISGQHQVSRAISPGADTAASALALLQETDDNFLSTTFDSIEAAAETVARQVLSLMVQFWDEPRLVKVTGSSSTFEAKMLKGSDLKNGTDVRMDAQSSLPISKSGKIATITDWIDKGIIPPEVGLEAMEMGTLGSVYNRIKVDMDQARRENTEIALLDVATVTQHYMAQAQQADAMAQAQANPLAGLSDPALGITPQEQAPMPAAPLQPLYPIGWMDNDEVHIREHEDYAKGQAYKALAPEIQKELETHVEAHRARLAERAQQQAMQQALAGVSGPQGATPQPDGYAGATPQPAAA